MKGWKILLIKLLGWCPHLTERVGVERCSQSKWLGTSNSFFSALVNAKDGELKNALENAKTYLNAAADESLAPGNDAAVWRLLESRVPKECYKHALRAVKASAEKLLDQHCDSGG